MEIEEKLKKNLAGLPWRYKILEEDNTVEFTNVEVESAAEEKFLGELEKNGSSKIIGGGGKFFYMITREDGRLRVHLARADGEIVESLGEITEKEALEMRKSSARDRKSFGGLLSLFRRQEEVREPVSNNIKIGYNCIEEIIKKEMEEAAGKSVVLRGSGFQLELRDDGGCRIHFDL
ncbi:hypothetical protein AKJ65_02235 [candidate division MSBL1 archaeon SCGC-AAA259E19]|uniref:Uncharacterized protein n=2 Tax=candidate division MSBL1 TaxID=215777 RepID=A0A133UYH1_9EURY|nr:hypothetical protein AKJ65_02235 [candidate division MSBL1 archaeon SCGC-AAA259E19]KXA99204.1 hypothetical protein AKJ41_05805 [candidate division MSBL1 archaeon SCGC-AAA259O05]